MQKKDLQSYPVNDYRDFLAHSAKGTTWKNHKYVAIKNGRYIYDYSSIKDPGGSGRKIPWPEKSNYSSPIEESTESHADTAGGSGRKFIRTDAKYIESRKVKALDKAYAEGKLNKVRAEKDLEKKKSQKVRSKVRAASAKAGYLKRKVSKALAKVLK